MMLNDARILILGGRGMVGSAIKRELSRLGFTQILSPASSELNLTKQSEVEAYFQLQKPEFVFMAAARVGGILANDKYRADFIMENTLMAANVTKACHDFKVKRLQFLGSSCIYPKLSPQPIREEALLTGQLEPTNEPYALAKIVGLKMAESYRRQHGDDFHSLMPTNLYGPGDNYHPENSHVIPGLIRRMQETIQTGKTSFEAWGSGSPRREFLHVDDLARACVQVMRLDKINFDWINVGYGTDVSIKELVHMIAEIMNFKGSIVFDSSRPDGVPQKLLDISKVKALGWEPRIALPTGLRETIKNYTAQI